MGEGIVYDRATYSWLSSAVVQMRWSVDTHRMMWRAKEISGVDSSGLVLSRHPAQAPSSRKSIASIDNVHFHILTDRRVRRSLPILGYSIYAYHDTRTPHMSVKDETMADKKTDPTTVHSIDHILTGPGIDQGECTNYPRQNIIPTRLGTPIIGRIAQSHLRLRDHLHRATSSSQKSLRKP